MLWVTFILRQWWIQGRGLGSPFPRLFLDPTEAQKAEKKFFENWVPLISGCGWQPTAPTPYLKVWIRHCQVKLQVSL